MKFCYITFRSVTFAQSAQRVLRKAGMESTLKRTPKNLEQRGCGYCLQLRQWEATTAVQLLRSQNREFGKAYVIGTDGSIEEMAI